MVYGGGASEIACALAVNQAADKVRSNKKWGWGLIRYSEHCSYHSDICKNIHAAV